MTTTNRELSVLSEESTLSGRITGQDVTILGGFDGELEVHGRLRVGPKARIRAKVKAGSVEIEGDFEGEVRTPSLSFGETARARGVFLADRLGIRDGAQVNGGFNLTSEKAAPPAPEPKPVPPPPPTEPMAAAPAPAPSGEAGPPPTPATPEAAGEGNPSDGDAPKMAAAS